MNKNDLKPASQLAQRFGVKAIVYSKPGEGKTPLLSTAPRPLILACEPGLMSMRNSQIPTYDAYTPERIDDFFKWFFESSEAKAFDTLGIDSSSQLAEIFIMQELARNKDGRKAYGELSRRVMDIFSKLFFMPNKHIILLAKQMQAEVGKTVTRENGAFSVEMQYQSQPYFPGNDLNIKVPHMFDAILHMSKATIPSVGLTSVIRSKGTPEILARDRSGMLSELEPPNLTNIFAKCMS